MKLEDRLRRVPWWVWLIVGIVALIIACCCGAGIGGARSEATTEASVEITQTTASSAPTTTPADVPLSPTSVQTPVSSDPCVGRDRCVSPENLDATWPLTVPWAQIDCMWRNIPGQDRRAMVWVVAPDGQSYAVNGTARSFLNMSPLDPIWADNPAIPGTKVNMGPLLSAGLLLCK